MIRRKQSKDTQETVGDGTNAQTQVPLGGDVHFPSKQPRRRKQRTHSSFRSCLIRLRILSDGRKKIDINAKRGTRGGGGSSSMCCLFSLLVTTLIVCFGIYKALEWIEGKNSNLIIRATTSITMEMFSHLEDLRPVGKEFQMPVVLYSLKSKANTDNIVDFNYPGRLHTRERRERGEADFGNIDLKLLQNDDQKRQIYIMVEDRQGGARSLDRERDDDYEQYWTVGSCMVLPCCPLYYEALTHTQNNVLYDDMQDIERNPYTQFDDYRPEEMEGICRRLPWHRYNLPSCNNMHELDLLTNTPRFVGDGAYREVFVTNQPYMGSVEEMIFKELRWDLEMAVDDFEYVRMDAFVTERLTSHPQITDIYGYCGLSMLTVFSFGDIEKDVVGYDHHREHFKPWKDSKLKQFNNFTGAEKLQLALNMVEPVAALHNFPGGVIVHDDIQLCQYLWTEEEGIGVKLNDFNRAEIMLWDEKAQTYCKYKNGRGHGDWRAPEEYKDEPLDEKIDIWSLGNNMYSVLTGYYPFADIEKDKQIQKLIKEGETAIIDPRFIDRSFAERKLIEVIQRCHEYDPDKRADINEIWHMLKDAIEENKEHEKEEERKNAEQERRAKEEAAAKAEAERRANEEAAAQAVAERQEKEAQQQAEAVEAQRRAKEAQEAEAETARKQAEAEEKRKQEEAHHDGKEREGDLGHTDEGGAAVKGEKK